MNGTNIAPRTEDRAPSTEYCVALIQYSFFGIERQSMLEDRLNVRSPIDVRSTTNDSINDEFIGLASLYNNRPYFLLLVVKNFLKENHKKKTKSSKIKQNTNIF